jgi:hypothetical protein
VRVVVRGVRDRLHLPPRSHDHRDEQRFVHHADNEHPAGAPRSRGPDAGAVPTIGIDRAVLHGGALPDGWPAVGGVAVSSGRGQTARSFGPAGIESPYLSAFSGSPSIVANDATLTDPRRSHTTQRHPRASKSRVPVRIYRFSARPTTAATRPPGTAQARRTRRAQSCARDSLSRPLIRASDSHRAISALQWWAA